MAYTAAAMMRARELHAHDWTPTEICRRLDAEGHGKPCVTTVKYWTNERYRQHHDKVDRARKRREKAANASFRLNGRSDEYRMAFMLRLRSRGISCHAIGVVCEIVFGERLTAHQVRYALREET